MEVALPVFAHLALFAIAFAAFSAGYLSVTRTSGVRRFVAASLLSAVGLCFLGFAIARL